MNNFFDSSPQLKVLPRNRAAYSDRTAWMMCELSALAYLPFEGDNPFKAVINAIDHTAKFILKKKNMPKVSAQFQSLEKEIKDYIDHQLGNTGDESPGLEQLKTALSDADFELVEVFNKNDTQAFLAKRNADHVAVLAFRGTEKNSWKDIKTDLNARFYQGQDGVRVHTGFRDAYNQVREQVRTAVDSLPHNYSLYITGHSLGGALAVMASKDLERDTLAACYTFGSPRVGNEEFGEEIRAPVYRIVNAADGVPRVPPSWLIPCIAFFISFIRPSWAEILEKNFGGYLHQGDMRYLTAVNGNISRLKVIANLSMPFRVWRLARRVLANGLSIAGKDHRIDEYRNKLRHYAKKRVID